MKEELKQALDKAFADLKPPAHLEVLKEEMAEALEDRALAMRKKGVIEEAALKKTLADFDKILRRARDKAGGDGQILLNEVAGALGLSPLGRKRALLRLAALMALGFGLLSAIIVWITGGSAAGSLASLAPFTVLALVLLTFLRR